MSLGDLSGISLVDRNIHPKGHYCNYEMLTSEEENMHKGEKALLMGKESIKKE